MVGSKTEVTFKAKFMVLPIMLAAGLASVALCASSVHVWFIIIIVVVVVIWFKVESARQKFTT